MFPYFLSVNTQESYFISKARIVEVLTQNGWYYVSCNHCGKKTRQLCCISLLQPMSSCKCQRCCEVPC
uniref:Uncharacterized protein n=1 Tax=Brassica campestris TaxID=3711 RepID=A0A3P6BFL2_BRACM|nr:unnamed protein product [Brassica rapa]